MQNLWPSMQLVSDPLRIPVEQLVSKYTGQPWRVRDVTDLRDFACHQAAIFSDGCYSVFVKLSEAAHGLEQFDIELAGLRLLAERSGALIPTPIGIIQVEGGTLMVLEGVRVIERGPLQWRHLDRRWPESIKTKGSSSGWKRTGILDRFTRITGH